MRKINVERHGHKPRDLSVEWLRTSSSEAQCIEEKGSPERAETCEPKIIHSPQCSFFLG